MSSMHLLTLLIHTPIRTERYTRLLRLLVIRVKQERQRKDRIRTIASLVEEYLKLTRYRVPYSIPKARFLWQNADPHDFHHSFRFEKADLVRLRKALRIPDIFVTEHRDRWLGEEALLLVLQMLAYPKRLFDLCQFWGRSASVISRTNQQLVDMLYAKWKTTIHFDALRLDHAERSRHVAAVTQKGMPGMLQIWGFIDGTVRPVARPQYFQKHMYSGHHKVHGLKYQAACTPDGILVHTSIALEGKRNDQALLNSDPVRAYFEQSVPHRLFGDKGYNVKPFLVVPFKGAQLTADMRAFNELCSTMRVCIEWQLGKVVTLWQALDWVRTQQVWLRPVAKSYYIAVLLTNVHTTMYGSQTADFFGCMPPTSEQYLSHPDL